MATIEQMGSDALGIKNEVTTGANTAKRVGQLFVDIIDYLGNLVISSGSGSGGGSSTLLSPKEPLLSLNNIGSNPGGSNKLLLWDGSGWGYTNLPLDGGEGLSWDELWGALGPDNPDGNIAYNHLSNALSGLTWWGQYLDNNKVVSGNMTNVGSITMLGPINIGAAPNTIQISATSDGLFIDGNVYASGGVSALGINGDGEGGEGANLLEPLKDINGTLYETISNWPSNGEKVLVCTKNGSNAYSWSYKDYIPVDPADATVGLIVNTLISKPGGVSGVIDPEWLDGYATTSDLAATNGRVSSLESWQRGVDTIIAGLPSTYLTIDDFDKLFEAQDNGGNAVEHPYGDTVDRIKAKFGLWTEQYLSALGIGSSGSSGVFDYDDMWSALSDYDGSTHSINPAYLPIPTLTIGGKPISNDTPSNGQVLKFNGSQWAPAEDISGGSGDVSGLTNRVSTLEGKLSGNKSIWGQKYLSGGVLQDIPTDANLQAGSVLASGNIEIKRKGNEDDSLYKGLRITNDHIQYVEIESGNTKTPIASAFQFYDTGIVKAEMGLWVNSGSPRVDNEGNCQCLRIGDGLLSWDSETNSIRVSRFTESSIVLNGGHVKSYSETPANLYATGGVSSLGIPNNPEGSVESANIKTLDSTTVNTDTINADTVNVVDIVVGDGKEAYAIKYNINPDATGDDEPPIDLFTHTKYTPAEGSTSAVTEKTVLGNDAINEVRGNKFYGDEFRGNKFFLDNNHYLAYTTVNNEAGLWLYSWDNINRVFSPKKVKLED